MNTLRGGSYSSSHRGCCNLLNLPDRKWIEHSVEVGKGRGKRDKSMAQSREGKSTDIRKRGYRRKGRGSQVWKKTARCKEAGSFSLSVSLCVCVE